MAEQEYITCMFSCNECGLTDVEVKVRARLKHEDLKYYVERVIAREVAHVHFVQSKECEAKKMKHLKIPLPPDGDPDPWIGKAGSNANMKETEDRG